jgi:hypothetical protein
MSTCQTLLDELQNNIINFVDGFGDIKATFDFCDKKPYFYGNITNDKETPLIKKGKKSKYNNMVNIQKNYYNGYYNPEKFNNIMGLIYKITNSKSLFEGKYDYILLIIDNPYYDHESSDISTKGKYKLIIYSIHHNGVYFKYLSEIQNYTSSI